MSRAFVKEWDDLPPEDPVLPERLEPRLVSAAGLAKLREEYARTTDPRRRAALERRIDAAVIAEPPSDTSRVGFGATVTVEGAADKEATFTIVGEDEDDVRAGRIAVTSPLAVALLGKRVGDAALWHRPAGDRRLTVRAIRYEGPA
jgi:transcription elongation factor GreB